MIDCYLESAILDSSASPQDNVLFLVRFQVSRLLHVYVIPKGTKIKVEKNVTFTMNTVLTLLLKITNIPLNV